MPKIHHFQRYSSVENTVTNNTLQLLARIYANSTTQASQLLTELTGELIEIGIEINQQERAESSVPDGAIIQRRSLRRAPGPKPLRCWNLLLSLFHDISHRFPRVHQAVFDKDIAGA
jgi:hypothetical protein